MSRCAPLLLLLACVTHQVYSQPVRLRTPQERPAAAAAALVIPQALRDQVDPVMTQKQGLFYTVHSVQTGTELAQALEQLARQTFSEVRVMRSMQEIGDAQVVIEPRYAIIRGAENSDGDRYFQLQLAVTVTQRPQAPAQYEYEERIPVSGAALFFGNYTTGPLMEERPVQLITAAMERLRKDLRRDVNLPLEDFSLRLALSRDDIEAVVRSHINDVNACHGHAPDVSGRLVMRWRVQRTGFASDVEAMTPELASSAVALCLKQQIEGWAFPPSTEASEPIVFPFDF
jgi:hypothetical protein